MGARHERLGGDIGGRHGLDAFGLWMVDGRIWFVRADL